MKTKMMHFMATAFLLGSAPGLFAQDDSEGGLFKPYVSFGFTFAQGNAHDLTQKTWAGVGAFAAEAGIQFAYKPLGMELRPNFGYSKILGDYIDETKPVYDLFGMFFGFDIVYQPPSWGPISFTLGPSFHSWSVEEVNALEPDKENQGERGIKFGWRFGIGYDVLSNLRVDFTFTQSEWRSSDELPFKPGFNPSLPAYFTLKASYSF
jgi:hypothetical protein